MTNIFFDDEPTDKKDINPNKTKQQKETKPVKEKKKRSTNQKIAIIAIMLVTLVIIFTILPYVFRTSDTQIITNNQTHTVTGYLTTRTITITSVSTCLVQAKTLNNQTYYFAVTTVTSGTYITTNNRLLIFENNTLVQPC